jgi:TonB family protein
MKQLILLLVILTSQFKFSFGNRTSSKENIGDTIRSKFIGGEDKYFEFLKLNLHYPKYCIDNCIQGVVVVKFTIDTLGNITDCFIVNSLHEQLDNQAKKVIELSSGKWIPAKINNIKRSEQLSQPISFFTNNIDCKNESLYFFELGQKEYNDGKLDNAEKYFTKSFQYMPNNYDALYNVIIIKLKKGDMNGACMLIDYMHLLGKYEQAQKLKHDYCN